MNCRFRPTVAVAHPITHAAEHLNGVEVEIAQRVAAECDAAMAAVEALREPTAAAEETIRTAHAVTGRAFSKYSGLYCACRVVAWYRDVEMRLAAKATALFGGEQRIVALSWAPFP